MFAASRAGGHVSIESMLSQGDDGSRVLVSSPDTLQTGQQMYWYSAVDVLVANPNSEVLRSILMIDTSSAFVLQPYYRRVR